MSTWIAVMVVGLGSYAFRVVPVVLMSRVDIPAPLERGLRQARTAALASLIVASVVQHERSAGVLATILATAACSVAAALTWRRRSPAIAVAAGVVVYSVGTALETMRAGWPGF